MSILSVTDARESRRLFRHVIDAFFRGTCPHCAQSVADLLDTEIDVCRRTVSYWPARSLVESAGGQRKGRAA